MLLRRLLLLWTILCLLALGLSAQAPQRRKKPRLLPNRFAEGYLLTHRGDTVEGYIDPGNRFKDQNKVYFFDYHGARTHYGADRIEGFSYDGMSFQAHETPYAFAGIFADSMIFLQRIVDGPARLYRFYTRRSVFTLQRGPAYFDLLIMPDNQEYEISYAYKWKRIGELLSDYPGMNEAIQAGDFKPEDTPELIKRYNLWYQQTQAQEQAHGTTRSSDTDP
jgi:hypothetical protein